MAKCFFYNEDCFDTMKRMQANKYVNDIILTSPPYATSRSKVKTQKAIDTFNRRYDICLDDMNEEEYAQWTVKLFDEFDKVLSENGVILYNISYGSESPNVMWLAMGELLKETKFMVADTIVWKKKSALPNNVSTNKLTRIIEFVFVICRKEEYKTFRANKKVTKVGSNGQKYYENIFNFIESPNNDGPCSLNKATYSSDLCLQLLNIYATNDSKVYDPFMGTGTTAVACDKFNEGTDMICVGSELSEAQVEYSKKRLSDVRWERRQLEIPFDGVETRAVNVYNNLKHILKNEIIPELNGMEKKEGGVNDKEVNSIMELLINEIKPLFKLYGKKLNIN